MKPKYLTFDCYGTLIDWRRGIEESLRRSLGSFSLSGKELLDAYVEEEKKEEATYKSYRKVLAGTALRLSGPLGVRVDQGAAERFAASVPDWPAFPDTREALVELGRRGYGRFILSNVDDDLLRGTIANNGLEIDGFVTAQQVGSYKPNRGHWDEFMRRTGASKEEFLHVAQSVFHDVIPTQEMGIASAWVNRYSEPLPVGAAPSYIVDSMEGLLGVIE